MKNEAIISTFKSIKKLEKFGFNLNNYEITDEYMEFKFINHHSKDDNEHLIIKHYMHDDSKDLVDYSVQDFTDKLDFDMLFGCIEAIYEFINEVIAYIKENKNGEFI